MNIEFYFDPSCPYSWIASRWLHLVSNQRNINIKWQPFSLGIKNNVLTDGDGQYDIIQRDAHRFLRVMLAAAEQHNVEIGEMYTTMGAQYHVAEEKLNDELIKFMLEKHSLPEDLLRYADDTSLDSRLNEYIKNVTDLLGENIGVPVIIFELNNKTKQGYFGPVLDALPEMSEALELWDGLSKLATSKHFYELKRSLPGGKPDVISTSKC